MHARCLCLTSVAICLFNIAQPALAMPGDLRCLCSLFSCGYRFFLALYARFFVMLPLLDLCKHAFLFNALFEAPERNLKRLILSHPDTGHPRYTPLLRISYCYLWFYTVFTKKARHCANHETVKPLFSYRKSGIIIKINHSMNECQGIFLLSFQYVSRTRPRNNCGRRPSTPVSRVDLYIIV